MGWRKKRGEGETPMGWRQKRGEGETPMDWRRKRDIIREFAWIDSNGDGTITADEMAVVLPKIDAATMV